MAKLTVAAISERSFQAPTLTIFASIADETGLSVQDLDVGNFTIEWLDQNVQLGVKSVETLGPSASAGFYRIDVNFTEPEPWPQGVYNLGLVVDVFNAGKPDDNGQTVLRAVVL